VPPLRIKGSARCAMRMKVQQETSMVVRKPSRETSTTRPASASFGEKAMECTTKSSLPQSLAMRSNTASIWPGVFTSSGITIGASRPERLGAAPRDRLIVGNADDQTSLPLEKLRFNYRNHARRPPSELIAAQFLSSVFSFIDSEIRIISPVIPGSPHAAKSTQVAQACLRGAPE